MAKRFRSESEEEEKIASKLCMETFNLANVLMLFSGRQAATGSAIEPTEGKMFECKTCSRKFTTFQALGGHRASHKKPRLGGSGTSPVGPEKPRVHECSVCGLEFGIGQALGGHMRRHRAAQVTGSGQLGGPVAQVRGVLIDLNLPPLDGEEGEDDRQLPKLLGFTLRPAMIDCFH